MEQLKILQKGRREQKACVREAINNIDDLEIVQKKKIDPLLLKDLIESCKLPVEFPQLLDEIPYPDQRSMCDELVSRHSRMSDQLGEDINAIEPRKSLTAKFNDVGERQIGMSLVILKEYLRDQSNRSSNVDSSNRTLSVVDELEAEEILH